MLWLSLQTRHASRRAADHRWSTQSTEAHGALSPHARAVGVPKGKFRHYTQPGLGFAPDSGPGHPRTPRERAETNESRAGVLSPRTLQLQPQKFCLSLFPGFYRTHWLCATALPSASQNVCGGDPGGPLFCGGYLAGIYMRDAMCSRRYPALFVSIAAYNDWIQKAFSGAQKALPYILWLSLRII